MIKKIVSIAIFFLVLFLIPNIAIAQEETYEGKIIKILEEKGNYQKIEIQVLTGDKKGENIVVENGMFTSSEVLKYKIGDGVVLNSTWVEDGSEFTVIADHVRRPVLAFLFAIFVFLTIIIAGKWGLTSILGMGYSFYVIFVFILPMILKGYDAVLVAVIGSIFIIPVTFSLSHGLNRKTLVAMIGTAISMVIVGLLSLWFVDIAKLTGFAVEEAGFLQYQLGDVINLKGILLAGIIISTLGVMDDITVSQSSIVEELRKANSKLSKKELFLRSMNVGKDHISSMVNTLVLVYSGAALPLLLLFVNNPHPFLEVINYEIVADEIVRTMVGSIGLILAVPITTYIAVNSFGKNDILKTSKSRE